MNAERFVERVLEHLPPTPPTDYLFAHWPRAGQPTEEGFGLLPVHALDAGRAIDRVMDVDRYAENLDHVVACRAIADDRFAPPRQVRFYQRVRIPLLGELHHELMLERLGEHRGYQVAAWQLLGAETEDLGSRGAMRSAYSEGAWLARDGLLGYALSAAPRREDVGRLRWLALTRGADALAGRVIRESIASMASWAARAG